MSFEPKVIIVTGGAASIGKGIAECFAEENARIVIADFNEEDGKATKAYLENRGSEVLFVKMDAAVEKDIKKVVGLTLEKWGRIDVLVNNVGTHLYKPLVDIQTQEWDYLMAVGASCRACGDWTFRCIPCK